MPDARYFCPTCGCIDVIAPNSSFILTSEGASMAQHTCPNCGWRGSEEEALGAYTEEKMWGIEEYAEVMLRVLAIHATAPLIQLLEFQGVIPREAEAKTEGELKDAQFAKDHIMKSVFVAATEAAFSAALEARQISGERKDRLR